MKLAVVLFNLGGPDGPDAVRPFLFNLFKDPAILRFPAIVRYPLAALIAWSRETAAQANYAVMGGRSPLRQETEAQAEALEAELRRQAPEVDARVFIAMRYWKPFAADTARHVAAFAPDELVLLPLYPQFSTATTASAVKDWAQAYGGPGRTRTVCCYPNAQGLVEAYASEIRRVWDAAGSPRDIRLLFSAHGLPQQVVDAGDPYEAQVRATAAAVAERIPELSDWRVCFQSRVGRLQWLQPYTDQAIREAGGDGKGVLICPIAFVSEHVETLVELDHEYAGVAEAAGVSPYLRARTPGVGGSFIGELARAVTGSLGREGVAPHGPWLCPAGHGGCARSEKRSI